MIIKQCNINTFTRHCHCNSLVSLPSLRRMWPKFGLDVLGTMVWRYCSGCLTVAPLFLGSPSKAHSFLHTCTLHTSTMLCAQTKDGSWWWPLSESHNTEHTSPMTQPLPIIHLCTAHLLIYPTCQPLNTAQELVHLLGTGKARFQ